MSEANQDFPEVNFQLTREELIDARMQIDAASNRARWRSMAPLIWVLVPPVLIGHLIILRWSILRESGIWFFLKTLGPMIFLSIAFMAWLTYRTLWARKKRITRSVDTNKMDLYFTPKTIRLTQEGLEEDTQYTLVRMKWLGISHVAENDRFLLFYVTNQVAEIVPKRAFSSPDHAKRFYDFALQHCSTMGQCPKCRYDLRGNTTRICPECGTSLASSPTPPTSPQQTPAPT